MSRPDIEPILEFLSVPTPQAWLDEAATNIPTLLIDHANCEKKAASTALSLIYRYVERSDLLYKMSRLAREELRHFEQVLDLMREHGVAYRQLGPSRYAGELHKLVRKNDPARLIDVLILGAVVEARSCERFGQLVQVLPASVGNLYRQLINSEARHFKDYLNLAEEVAAEVPNENIADRIAVFLQRDAELVQSVDEQFRFHSGVPG